MAVIRHTINLGMYSMHVIDAVSSGGKLIVRFSDNRVNEKLGVISLLSDEYDVTPDSYKKLYELTSNAG